MFYFIRIIYLSNQNILLNFHSSIPNYFVWLRYLSWYSYAFETIMISQWENVNNIHCEYNSTFCYQDGEQVISFLKLEKVKLYLKFFY